MRCHYISDLHLEFQDFQWKLPKGDVLIIAGDLCHARCLDPARRDKYSIDQRARVMRFAESAVANFCMSCSSPETTITTTGCSTRPRPSAAASAGHHRPRQ